MDNITYEEKQVVEELKERTIKDVSPKMLEDVSLFYRFAKARDFNLEQAEAMLRKHLTWRKELGVDTILTDYQPSEFLLKYVPLSIPCYDKDGCAVMVHDLGRADAKGLLNVVKKTDVTKYLTYFLHQMKEKVIKESENGNKRYQLGKPILTPIYDFDELTYAKAVNVKGLQLVIHTVKTFLDNYPEYLHTITIINAPIYFTWLYAALKPLLPITVIQKIRIYGTDDWKEALLKLIEPDDLPAYLGGNKRDPDGNPFCKSIIVFGQTIPKDCQKQKRKRELALQSDVEKITVSPLSKEEITFKVEENSYLEWEFETKNRDIDFSLSFRGKSLEIFEIVELIPKERIDTNYEPEKGCFLCEKTGNYTIVFEILRWRLPDIYRLDRAEVTVIIQ
ncbi:SEC14-like protein 2 like protein [Argiope bruennichi]|uniref:SEC14-like protein 2 like protein n=1 Tax=Argiope bruennichi TaxID=94029 RepID=A0A8T0FQG8_ARGBR|nr:SEC14-like protein 2 like protein [Argiope bruennichi]